MQNNAHLMPKSTNLLRQLSIILSTMLKVLTEAGHIKQPRGETNRLEHRQSHHTTHSGITKGNSNTRKSCHSTTSSCRDRSPTPFPHKCNKICKDTNQLPHLDTKSIWIGTMTLQQNSQNSTNSTDFPSSQDHVQPETSHQQFSPKNTHPRPFATKINTPTGFF